jgi:polysaccharide biosynthesis protein PslH
MRILWLKTELLHPVDKGGKIRSYHLLKQLKKNHQITYLTLDDGSAPLDAVASASEYCDELIRIPHATREKFSAGFYAELAANMASPLPYAIRKYKSHAMTKAIEETESRFDVVICDFLAPAVNLPSKLQTPVVLFQHNVEAEIWRRHYEVQSNAVKKRYLYWQWRKMQKFERIACQRMDRVVAVSEADSQMMERDYGLQKVYDIPTGVDVDFFRPGTAANARPNSLVFTGSMDWLPNEDAINYFTQQILPLIKNSVPDVSITVVGRNPSRSLQELGQREASITVTGRVEDVRPYMEEAAAYVVPLRIGGGTRLKIYEALAMEKPTISTTVGAEGLDIKHGEHILLADTPSDFANAVVRVFREPNFAQQLGANAAQTVRERFSWGKVATEFDEICRSLNHKDTKTQNGKST